MLNGDFSSYSRTRVNDSLEKLTVSQMLHKVTHTCKWEVREITEKKCASKKIISICVLLLPGAVKITNIKEDKREPILTGYP